MAKKIVIIGNQNAGKTTLFNELTGLDQYVGNWPGVTVDKVEGKVSGTDWHILDLPGLYSLSPYSPEEIVSRDCLMYGDYDVILNVIDATHLDRSLYLTLEALSFKKPTVIALNMADKAKAMNINVDANKLSELLGVKVIPISASKGRGIQELVEALDQAHVSKTECYFGNFIDNFIKDILPLLKKEDQSEFFATSLIQNDDLYISKYQDNTEVLDKVHNIQNRINNDFKTDPEELIASKRYAFIDKLILNTVTKGRDKDQVITKAIDNIVTNKFLAFPIFIAIVWFIYYIAVSTVGTYATDYANDVIFGTYATEFADNILTNASAPEWLSGLIIDGVIGGVGAVLGFVPQMVVLFLMLGFLEQCGYMTRVAFILDRLFRYFGLSGKSFIPMIIASGCAVPALMASKTIDNINERRMALITTSFVPCSAKLPVLTMICASFFPNDSWIAPAIYVFAVFSIIITALMLKKLQAFKENVSPFVLELPDYHMPTIKSIVRTVYERCRAFVIKAGTFIFATVVIVWFLSSFNFTENGFMMVDIKDSMIASIGSVLAFIFIPLGFGSFEATVSILTGFLAKENVVSSLAVLIGLAGAVEGDATLSVALQSVFDTKVAALAFLAFNLFSTPCVAALSAMNRRLESRRLFLFAIGYLLSFAYAISFLIYEFGGLITKELSFDISSVIAIIVTIVMLYLILRREKDKREILIKVKMV